MRYFEITFNDLSWEKKEELIQEIKRDLLEQAEQEGKEFLNKKWNEPKPKDWKEAYIRIYGIDYDVWSEYERGESVAPNWDFILDRYLEEKAEEKLYQAFKYLEVEVDVRL
jgi:hypothetical protein